MHNTFIQPSNELPDMGFLSPSSHLRLDVVLVHPAGQAALAVPLLPPAPDGKRDVERPQRRGQEAARGAEGGQAPTMATVFLKLILYYILLDNYILLYNTIICEFICSLFIQQFECACLVCGDLCKHACMLKKIIIMPIMSWQTQDRRSHRAAHPLRTLR